MSQFCNAYGAENPGGAVAFGGLLPNPVVMQHICRERPVMRGRWVCACGHKGSDVVGLCAQHWGEFTGQKTVRGPQGHTQAVPWNVRRDVQACPRCASQADRPEEQHKCAVRLEPVS